MSAKQPQSSVSPLSGVAPPTQHQFKPGKSGNPGGLPRTVREARKQAAKASPEIIRRMTDIALTEEPKYAIPAAALVLERGLGKAATLRELHPTTKPDTDTDSPTVLANLNDDQRARIYAIIREGLA